jgi:hypothetical protein
MLERIDSTRMAAERSRLEADLASAGTALVRGELSRAMESVSAQQAVHERLSAAAAAALARVQSASMGLDGLVARMAEIAALAGEERLRLLGRLETARLLERSIAMSTRPAPGQDTEVPTLDQVRERIDERWAVAAGNADLAASETDAELGRLEHLLLEAAGRRRLDEIRDRPRLERPPKPTAPK